MLKVSTEIILGIDFQRSDCDILPDSFKRRIYTYVTMREVAEVWSTSLHSNTRTLRWRHMQPLVALVYMRLKVK